jgi:fatty-acyl-CoA synthase
LTINHHNYYFIFKDRLDVYPGEIEDCLLKHSNVCEAVAFGVSVDIYDQEVCAWVKLKNDSVQTTPEDLIKFCQSDSALAAYKVPRFIKLVNEFPTSHIGKYLRRAMQDAYKIELGL